VTERCVFRLTPEGLEIEEVAPGVDTQRDILIRMDFRPVVGESVAMDARIFKPEPMGLRKNLVHLAFDSRFVYDAAKNVLFVNFERFEVRSLEMVEAIACKIVAICEPLGRRVHVIVNYEGFVIDREMEDAWTQSISEIVQRWYVDVTRYTTSAFLRAKLGQALSARKLAPHVFETEEEARAALPVERNPSSRST
jgi:propionate CoA-transferase